MKKIKVALKDRSYDISIESGLLNKIPKILKVFNRGQKWVLITQEKLMSLYGKGLVQNLALINFDISTIILPDGESIKSIKEFERTCLKMLSIGCDRYSSIITLGGGAVGDLSGFVASTYMRGIEYFQIPTTFLAMIDSSIGGKTAVNANEGKNIIGTIYQPKSVFIDPNFLKSLDKKEVNSGFGEMIKYGAIWDKDLFEKISTWLDNTSSFPFEKAIIDAVKIKSDIVSKDEKEKGLRIILNFGHTIGHAIESYYGYEKIKHGEAVAFGMKCAGFISNRKRLLSAEAKNKLFSILEKLTLPNISDLDKKEIIKKIKSDKKSKKGRVKFVLLSDIGKTKIVSSVPQNLIEDSLEILR